MSKYNVCDLVAIKNPERMYIECEKIEMVLEVKHHKNHEYIGKPIYATKRCGSEIIRYISEDEIVGKVTKPN